MVKPFFCILQPVTQVLDIISWTSYLEQVGCPEVAVASLTFWATLLPGNQTTRNRWMCPQTATSCVKDLGSQVPFISIYLLPEPSFVGWDWHQVHHRKRRTTTPFVVDPPMIQPFSRAGGGGTHFQGQDELLNGYVCCGRPSQQMETRQPAIDPRPACLHVNSCAKTTAF